MTDPPHPPPTRGPAGHRAAVTVVRAAALAADAALPPGGLIIDLEGIRLLRISALMTLGPGLSARARAARVTLAYINADPDLVLGLQLTLEHAQELGVVRDTAGTWHAVGAWPPALRELAGHLLGTPRRSAELAERGVARPDRKLWELCARAPHLLTRRRMGGRGRGWHYVWALPTTLPDSPQAPPQEHHHD